MLDSSNPPSTPLLWDLSTNTSSLPVATFPLPKFGTYVFLKDTSSVVTMNSQISSYVAC
jgi:hypothetical protein